MKDLKTSDVSAVVGLCNDTEWYRKLRQILTANGETPNINLSVVIPYYKRPITLKQTLYSFLKSSYDLSKVEFVIADDGSDHVNRPNLEEYIELGLDVKYVWQQDLGFRLSAVRNLGVACASYDNIIILDCDLVVSKDFLLEHAWPLSISSNMISVGLRESRVYDSTNLEPFKTANPADLGKFESEDWRLKSWIDKVPNFELSDECWRMCSGGNIGFHRSLFERVGNFSERFTFWGGEDLEWAYRAHKQGAYFLVNRDAYAYHFEAKSSEFQINRSADVSAKDSLLKELVPVRKHEHLSTEGEVPYVSVFITHYNKAQYLKQAIESVPKATKYRYEIVIVDDGSDDNYVEAIDTLPPKLRSKVVVHGREHKGAEQTYADCLNLCRGEYIAQLDADDVLLPGGIDALVDALRGSVCDIAYGKYKKFDKDIQKLTDGWVYPLCDRFNSLFVGMHTHPLRVFRSRALNRQHGFRSLGLTAAVDFSLYSQMLLSSVGIFVDKETYLYRQVPTSLTVVKSASQTQNTKDVVISNLEKMTRSYVNAYTLSENGSKNYQIRIAEDVAQLVCVDHLGLHTETLSNLITRDPHSFTNPKLVRIQNQLGARILKMVDAHTRLEFEVRMESSEYVRYYREAVKRGTPLAKSIETSHAVYDLK